MIIEKINLLNPMQKSAVLKTEGPLLLLAGAGSGKTRVLTHRIAYLIEQGISPFNILAITFTNKAAREMRERVQQITPFGNEVWVSTFHSTCVRILRREINILGYSNQFTIYDPDDSERVLKDIYKNNNINEKNIPYKYMLNEISKQKDKLICATKYEQENFGNFKKKDSILIYKEYENILKSNNALDFDDLIFQTVKLFTQNPNILEKYQNRFKYIMVDEYQDTSTSQYNLVKLLASKYKNICVVGDDDQSIYGWRGADIKNIFKFEKDFADAQVIKLEQNYRSTKTILNAANSVIENNFARKPKSLWTENDDGSPIKFNRCNSDREEAIFVANEIKSKVEKGLQYNEFAILYRNNTLSRLIEEQLVYLGIPYRLYGGVNFYSRKEIKDILAYLKILYNPNDDVSLKRIINTPKRSIGNTTVDKLSKYADEQLYSIFYAIQNVEKIESLKTKVKNILSFYNLIEDFKEYSKTNKISDIIKYVLDKTGYLTELQEEMTEESNSRIENIDELINKAIEFETTEENPSLEQFLEEISLVSSVDLDEEDMNKVTLMTLHSSKGLEFPTVFIIGFEEGIFPSYSSIISSDFNAMEEERRLCYVGITRAKKELFITCSKTRLQKGRYDSNLTSRFFKEIPKDYVLNLTVTKNNTTQKDFTSSKNNSTYRPKINYSSNLNSYIHKDIITPKNFKIEFSEGDTIKHFKFGTGIVKKIQPAGADYEVTVDFENVGIKKLMANLSKLQKI